METPTETAVIERLQRLSVVKMGTEFEGVERSWFLDVAREILDLFDHETPCEDDIFEILRERFGPYVFDETMFVEDLGLIQSLDRLFTSNIAIRIQNTKVLGAVEEWLYRQSVSYTKSLHAEIQTEELFGCRFFKSSILDEAMQKLPKDTNMVLFLGPDKVTSGSTWIVGAAPCRDSVVYEYATVQLGCVVS